MAACALMLQGTGSSVGKSLLTAGLCRAFARRGLRVRPFKAQNMSNNAALALRPDGALDGEIGRAQALQARACGVVPSVHMNPVLLKPQSDTDSQVVVRGEALATVGARDYYRLKPFLLPRVLESFAAVKAGADLVIVEGAGAAAETNLRAADIANMGFAEAAKVPVVVVADIDRGGVIASVVGTEALLSASEKARVAGYIINKFRGDPRLFDGGLEIIAAKTGWRNFGVAPWFDRARALPAEDVMALETRGAEGSGGTLIAMPRLSRIANFDDLDPLALEPGVATLIVQPGEPIPAETDIVFLPGSKATRADLAFLREQGWDVDIYAHVRRGGRVIGLCAGYQMLGRVVKDPNGVEGPPGETPGLGLLDIETVMTGDKRLAEVIATDRHSGAVVRGYEMRMGRTEGPGLTRPWLSLDGRAEGAVSPDGRVRGGYVHGLFSSDRFRGDVLRRSSGVVYEQRIEATLDALADHLEAHLDVEGLRQAAA